MKNQLSNIQISAVSAEFKNGKTGYTVLVKGLDEKLNCKMNFTEPLKAMRYMFVLAKRLKLQVNTIDLAAVQIDYLRAKEQLDTTAKEVSATIEETAKEEAEPAEEQPSPSGVKTIREQYEELKGKHPNAVLLFRVGDFYESYLDDAHVLSKVLGKVAPQYRNEEDILTAGFPVGDLDINLPKLIRAGRRAAICDLVNNSKVVAK